MGRLVDVSQELLERKGGGAFGFYTTGQLFLEEYYTLGVIGKAGLGTPHMDGNTRLCTATAAAALKESFGSDGQPGSYTDIDHADCIALYGHNVAATQTTLWSRMLDRRRGPEPPALVCVDPRRTPVAEEADVHLAPLPGTNVALMDGILHELLAHGWMDEEFLRERTVGLDEVRAAVEPWTVERAAQECDVRAEDLREAARLIGTSRRLLSTVLQGFYQSHQGTEAAVQVNNVHLLRGMLGRPGCGVLQMNGQPSAQNTRECGANGDLPGFRNWDDQGHIEELADLWGVDPIVIPHHAPPTHAMQIWRYAEQGSIELLWISATNPAVSLPQLPRVREILAKEGLTVVVQDLFLTETARAADIVLPAATQGEKDGCFTNTDRTVHFSAKAVDPPGEARPDLDILVDYARRMDFRRDDGTPLISWDTPDAAFEAWKACTAGRPCDYTGLSHARLRAAPSGIQWPCPEGSDGTERLYTDHVFPTAPEACESYGHDMATGAPVPETDYRARRPDGRAILKGSTPRPREEGPSEDFPLVATTGRVLFHFHTRTKTKRAPELEDAAPDAWVQVSGEDAVALGVAEGDVVRVESARGAVRVPARIGGIRRGVVFLPFHYGYWDVAAGTGPDDADAAQAANELTRTAWDPVSKQPLFKLSAVRIVKEEPA
jgi:anaerobic selenocysteine-containing dehydrogenase